MDVPGSNPGGGSLCYPHISKNRPQQTPRRWYTLLMRLCINCGVVLVQRHKIKFCSNECQHKHQHKRWVVLWKNGKENGNIGITARNISKHLKRYLIEKFGNKCLICGWEKRHPSTGLVPLEIDHIDGNSENSREDNLRLLCPNCHALTPFYKNLNNGNGRRWRMNKYIKNS